MKKRLLQVDFNTWHFICNMQCQYCIKHFDYMIEDNNLLIRKAENETYIFYANLEHLFIREYNVLKKLRDEYEIGILTFSGSETFLFNNIFELLEKIDGWFPKIQLITNGLNLNETSIEKIKKLKSIHISLSLDGHTLEGNYSRTVNDCNKLSTILKTLDLLVESKIPFDIYTVITKYNVGELGKFFSYLERKKPNCTVQLWPVFGNRKLLPDAKQIASFQNFVESLDDFNLLLQPKIYYQNLIKYLKSSKRELPCYLPYCSFYLKDNGEVKACLCNGIIDLGNVLNNSSEEIFNKQNTEVFYKDILSCEKHLIPCSKCFINWDLVNMYFNSQASIEDLKRLPLLNHELIVSIIEEYKQKFMSL